MYKLTMPLDVGSLHLTNRLVMPPMATAKAEKDGTAGGSLIDYYAEKSLGGYLGLIIIEHSYVSPLGQASLGQLSVAGERTVPGLRRLAQEIHRNGPKTVMQINHAGSATSEEVIRETPVGPSAVANPRKGGLPRELNHEEIAQIIESFAEAARRVKEAGFDGVEIHAAHGYLLNQFFSPLTNRRLDEYGGELRSRLRLHLEVLEAVRGAVGPDYPVLMRWGASDCTEGGVTLKESCRAARYLAEAGLDILDISGGMCGYSVPGLNAQGYFAPWAAAIKQAVSLPVILTGGITEAMAAERLLEENKADLIGVGRALLNDSAWAGKAMESLI
ncbi:flavin oxidoreductase / NADH oxidase family [Acididesulfobacillus acetoxydans]|uniref:NADH oxidase n=1 Tax=Acididesulfobacillus acetoxydans TaxID=1561005 RepID=A0A8S0W3M4_9FIRM|nr:NADH:flavin oxidoreductase [Acididesulfobacillus acetoxydans]CAA7601838.1 flavin oxidoreductase / NADH oxidase family [Acididesulfobacillus acetoxydans]CEJ06855.1 NADH oxidase [Acididesulfobacillus acetoxydans]